MSCISKTKTEITVYELKLKNIIIVKPNRTKTENMIFVKYVVDLKLLDTTVITLQ